MNLLREMDKARSTTVPIPTETANSLGAVMGPTSGLAWPPQPAG
jgi:hypothetical protein